MVNRSKVMQLGFVVNDLSGGQIAHSLINEINKNDSQIDALCFQQEVFAPCVWPNFALCKIGDEAIFYGHLIVCDANCLHFLKNSYTNYKYWYITDLYWVRKNEQPPPELFDDDIVKIARSREFLSALPDKNIAVVEDFNLKQFEEICNAKERKSN